MTIPVPIADGYICPCPRCGYPDSIDQGPYEYLPGIDDQLGGPPDPRIHLLWCGRCRRPFDVGPAELATCEGCNVCQSGAACHANGCTCE